MHNSECENKRDRILLVSLLFFCYCCRSFPLALIVRHTMSISFSISGFVFQFSPQLSASIVDFAFDWYLSCHSELEKLLSLVCVCVCSCREHLFGIYDMNELCPNTWVTPLDVMVYNSMKLIQNCTHSHWQWKWNGTRNEPQQIQNSKRQCFNVISNIVYYMRL